MDEPLTVLRRLLLVLLPLRPLMQLPLLLLLLLLLLVGAGAPTTNTGGGGPRKLVDVPISSQLLQPSPSPC